MKKVTLLLAVLFSFCAVNTAFAGNVKGSRDAWPSEAWPSEGNSDAWPTPAADNKTSALRNPILRAVAKADVAVKKANERKICARSGKQIDPETGSCGIAECQDGCTALDLSDYNDPVLLEEAEKCLQEDREAHGGHARHSLEFYYLELLAEQQEAAAKTAETPLTCGRCGKAMSAHQHCVDTNYTDLCSSMAEENELDPILLEQAEELLQADREAHGGYARHSLEFYYLELKEAQAENAAADQNAQAAQKHYCIYCGEEIDRDNKPCPQSNGLQTCRSTCPECGEDLNTTKNLVNNIHRCKFKGEYTIHPNTMKMITK